VKDIADKIGVKPAYIGLGVGGLAALLILLNFGTTWVGFMVGFLYPAYMSFKAIEGQEDKEESRLWLTYWVVFGSMNVFDRWINLIFSFVPFFQLIKIAYYVWLFHPKTKGAFVIYDKVLRNLLKKYESKIDENLSKVEGEITKKFDENKGLLNDAKNAAQKEMVNKAVNSFTS